jgi:hypothetical protein
MNTAKFLAYNPQNDAPFLGDYIALEDTWLEAARAAMSADGYAVECREITEDDLPSYWVIVDAAGVPDDDFSRSDSAREAEEELAEAKIEDPEYYLGYTVKEIFDESRAEIGQFGLWATSGSHGNNIYDPIGIQRRDFICARDSAEDCYSEVESRGEYGSMHMRYHIVVVEAVVNADGEIIEYDGVSREDCQVI